MLVVVGLNQRSASVGDRERLAVGADDAAACVRGYAALAGVDESVLLSTCCRVEVYAETACPAAAGLAIRRALAERAGPDLPLFELHGDEALRHLASVAASLESAVLGEPQILGQVKDAHQRAIDAGACGKGLGAAFERAYQIAKRVRTETDIGRAGVSWGSAAAAFAAKVLGPLRGRRVVVLGAGEMARATARHLRDEGARIAVLNRTLARAEALAAEVGGDAGPLDGLGTALAAADVVVSAAPVAPEALSPAALAVAMKARRRRDLVLVDLAVPRAVPPASGDLEGVWLCDVDDLTRVTERALADRAAAVAQARAIVDEEVARFARDRAARRAAPVIQALRAQAAAIAREEVERTARRIGADPEIERRLDAMANAVVSKLLHAPSARLREAAGSERGADRLMAAAVQMFGLSGDRTPPKAA